jgi:hypothetical protein
MRPTELTGYSLLLTLKKTFPKHGEDAKKLYFTKTHSLQGFSLFLKERKIKGRVSIFLSSNFHKR